MDAEADERVTFNWGKKLHRQLAKGKKDNDLEELQMFPFIEEKVVRLPVPKVVKKKEYCQKHQQSPAFEVEDLYQLKNDFRK